MDEPTKPASGKDALKRKSPDEERLLVIKEYISNLREIIRSLRKNLH